MTRDGPILGLVKVRLAADRGYVYVATEDRDQVLQPSFMELHAVGEELYVYNRNI